MSLCLCDGVIVRVCAHVWEERWVRVNVYTCLYLCEREEWWVRVNDCVYVCEGECICIKTHTLSPSHTCETKDACVWMSVRVYVCESVCLCACVSTSYKWCLLHPDASQIFQLWFPRSSHALTVYLSMVCATIIYSPYPQNLHFLPPPLTFVSPPHLLILYIEWLYSLVLSENSSKKQRKLIDILISTRFPVSQNHTTVLTQNHHLISKLM